MRADQRTTKRNGNSNKRPVARNAKPRSKKSTRPPAAPKIVRRSLPIVQSEPAQVPCLSCGLCCSYVAVDCEPPTSLRGATDILWYLYHEGVSVYTDGDEWMVVFDTRCRHLQDDDKCRIYDTRPEICREFDETTCEANSDELGTTFVHAPEFLT